MLRWVAALPRRCWGAIGTLYLYVPHNTGFASTSSRCLRLPPEHILASYEQVRFLRTGIDGVFTDWSDIGVIARAEFLSAKAAA